MKALVVLFTTLILLSSTAWSIPSNNIIGEIPNHKTTVSETINYRICVVVAKNSIRAKANKNNNIPLEISISQLNTAISNNKSKGIMLDDAGKLTNALSLNMIKNIYATPLKARTKKELANLGMIIHENCFNRLMESAVWEYEETI